MNLKNRAFLALAMLAIMPSTMWAATYYAHCTTVSTGHGSVYVTKAEGGVDISTITDSDWKSDKDDTWPDRSGEGDCTVYAYAKADTGYAFAGWYADKACTERESTANPYEKSVHAGARIQMLAANQTIYAKFSAVTVPITSVTLNPASQGYDGTEKSVSVTVRANDVTLGPDDYEIISGTTSGVVGSLTEDTVTTVTVRGKGGYTGEKSATWTIAAPSGSFAAPTGGSSQTGTDGYSVFGNTVTLATPAAISSTYDGEKGTWKVSMTVNWPAPVNKSWSGDTAGHAEYIDAAHAFVQIGNAVYSGSDILDSGTSTPNLTAETGKSEYTQGVLHSVSYTYFKSVTYTVEFSAADIEAAKAKDGRLERELAAWSLAWTGSGDEGKNQYSQTGLRVTTYTLTIPIGEDFILTDKFGNQVYPKPAHDHGWTFSGSGTDVITATCTNMDSACTIGTVGIGLIAEDREYDGKPFAAALSNATAFAAALGQDIGEIEYYDENLDLLDSAPTRAGHYMALLVIGEDEAELIREFSITRPSGGYTSGWELGRENLNSNYWACYNSVAEAAQFASDGDTVYYRGQGTEVNLDRVTDFSSDADITVDLGGKTFTRDVAAQMHITNSLAGTVTLVNGTLKQPTNDYGVDDIYFDGNADASGVIVLGAGIKVVNYAKYSGFLKLHANGGIKLNIVDGEYDIAALGVSNGGVITITGGMFGLRDGHPIERNNLAKFTDSSCSVIKDLSSGKYMYEVVALQTFALKIPVAQAGYTYVVSNGTEKLEGNLENGTNTYVVVEGDLIKVCFTLKDRHRWSGSEPENPMEIGPIAGSTVVDAGDLPTAERIPLTPGDVAGPYENAWAAILAMSENPLTPTDEVRLALQDSELIKAYTDMFAFRSYQVGGKYYITYCLTEDGTNALVQSANAMAANIDLAAIAALPSGETASLTVENGVPGFYYSLYDGATITDLAADANVKNLNVLCGPDGKVTFSEVGRPSDTAGFFLVVARELPEVTPSERY